MTEIASKIVCIVDGGQFADFASTLAKSFKRVYLYVPWESNPTQSQLSVGQGLKGVTKVDHWSLVIDEVDLWIFLDVYNGPLQEHLVSLGKRVWGSRMGEELELYREDFKEHAIALGLNIGPYEVVKGITNLRVYLKENEDVYVKVSRTRGDFETFKARNYNVVEPLLSDLESRLGAKKELVDFIVEDSIPDAAEIASDGYCIDGKFPSQVMSGLEVKDRAYVGVFKPYAKTAKQIRDVNSKLAATLRDYKYRNFLAIEMRITKDGIPWVIDPCCRAGSPPSQLIQLMYSNLAEIMWAGANGELIDPIPAGKWGALCLMITEDDHGWEALEFPPEIRDNVKLHYPVVIDDRYWIAPSKYPEIGAVVAVGATMEEAIDKVKELAGEIKGEGIEIPVDQLDAAQSQIDSMREYGISFT